MGLVGGNSTLANSRHKAASDMRAISDGNKRKAFNMNSATAEGTGKLLKGFNQSQQKHLGDNNESMDFEDMHSGDEDDT